MDVSQVIRKEARVLEGYEVPQEQFWDDMTGEELDARLVKKARAEEMMEVMKHGIYRKVDIKECWDRTGKKPI